MHASNRSRYRAACIRLAHRRSVLFALCIGFIVPGGLHAEWVGSIYGGKAPTRDTDVTLTQPDVQLTFEGVPWEDDSFRAPIYYGLRLNYWMKDTWGVALDFTHAKMHAEGQQKVAVAGTRDGAPVDAREPVGDTFEELSFSHGHNLLTLNLLYRGPPLGDDGLAARLWPYAGIGAGVATPHVEVSIGGVRTAQYQTTGPVYQVLAGISLQKYERIAFFAEYKLSYANLDVDLRGGGFLELEPWTHHFIFGVSYRFSD